jgi:hypothetical protein
MTKASFKQIKMTDASFKQNKMSRQDFETKKNIVVPFCDHCGTERH